MDVITDSNDSFKIGDAAPAVKTTTINMITKYRIVSRSKFVPAKIVMSTNGDLQVRLIDKKVYVNTIETTPDMEASHAFLTNEIYHETATRSPNLKETGKLNNGITVTAKDGTKPILLQKRFVSSCTFALKRKPISYSETVIVKIGSNKKNYLESVNYGSKLVPERFHETMYLSLGGSQDIKVTEAQLFCENVYIPITAN